MLLFRDSFNEHRSRPVIDMQKQFVSVDSNADGEQVKEPRFSQEWIRGSALVVEPDNS